MRLSKDNIYDVAFALHLHKRNDVKYLLGLKKDAELRELERKEVLMVYHYENQKLYCPRQVSKFMHKAIKKELDEKYGKNGLEKLYFEVTGKKLKV